MDYKEFFEIVSSRYKGSSPDSLIHVLTPVLIPILSLDKSIIKLPGQSHYRASFTIPVNEINEELIVRGRTGKFVPKSYVDGNGIWREIAKGRIIEVDYTQRVAQGEVYTGGSKSKLEESLKNLKSEDYLEIDQYGAAAKVLSGLVEYSLSDIARGSGYVVRRMPEDMARHLGEYPHYDFEFEKDDLIKRVEVKSLWGTNTEYARLIHGLSKDYVTSSCKFKTQEIFAVSLFLRTGHIGDFAFARSIPEDFKPYGLPRSSNHPDYVNQNPVCTIGDGKWFPTIDDVWNLD